MTVYHFANRIRTGTCMRCGVEKPDDELAIYMNGEDMSWHGICEDCHERREVLVKFWELYKLSELRSGTAFPHWWKYPSVYYCDTTED